VECSVPTGEKGQGRVQFLDVREVELPHPIVVQQGHEVQGTQQLLFLREQNLFP